MYSYYNVYIDRFGKGMGSLKQRVKPISFAFTASSRYHIFTDLPVIEILDFWNTNCIGFI